jgi:diacylglycerol kinase
MPRSWPAKFRDAFRGLWLALRVERSFAVHLPMAAAVLVAAIALRVSLIEACVLGLCVTVVMAAEIFNTALEFLSREVTREQNPRIGVALEMASAAVLVTAIGSAAIGGTIFVYRLGVNLAWWT